MKRLLAAVCLFASIALIGCGAPSSPTARAAPSPSGANVQQPIFKVPLDGAAIQGPADALVTVVEFTDYQCPFCSRANTTLESLLSGYGDKVRVAVHQNPLGMHPRSRPAALAMLAADEQGKYFALHDLMFAHQQQLDAPSIDRYAEQAGLSLDAFHQALQSGRPEARLAQELALSGALGINSTPTFFINGRRFSGAQPAEAFRAVIDEELTKAETLVKQGVPATAIYEHVIANGATAQRSRVPTQAAMAAIAPVVAPKMDNAEPGDEGCAPSKDCQGGCDHAVPTEAKAVSVPARAPSRGSANAKVTLVEFSDFECPFCARGADSLREVEQRYGDRVQVVFRNHPLPIHAHAELAAEAADAAADQGKFWEYHDVLFAHQKALDRASLEQYAQQVGLDLPRFRAALDQRRFAQDVSADLADGAQLGVLGTPTMFVNGRQITGAQPIEVLAAAIDEELAKPAR